MKSPPVTTEPVFCTCRKPDDGSVMIQCNHCNEWYHIRCVRVAAEQLDSLREYHCPPCERKRKQRGERAQARQAPSIEDKDSNKIPRVECREKKRVPRNTTNFNNNDQLMNYDPDQDPVRKTVVEGLTHALGPYLADWQLNSSPIASNSRQSPLIFTSAKELALAIEQEMFDKLAEPTATLHSGKDISRCGNTYRAKYRTLQFNLKDPKNGSLRSGLITGHISTRRLIEMTPAEMANDEIAAEIKRIFQQSIANVTLEEEAQGANGEARENNGMSELFFNEIMAFDEGINSTTNTRLSRTKEEEKRNDAANGRVEEKEEEDEEEDDDVNNGFDNNSDEGTNNKHNDQQLSIESIPSSFWLGKIYISDFEVKRLACWAHFLGGSGTKSRHLSDSELPSLLPHNLHCSGRIGATSARSYVSQVWQGISSSREVILFRLMPIDKLDNNNESVGLSDLNELIPSHLENQEQQQFNSFITHLAEHNRWAVIAHDPKGAIRDFYLAPWIPPTDGEKEGKESGRNRESEGERDIEDEKESRGEDKVDREIAKLIQDKSVSKKCFISHLLDLPVETMEPIKEMALIGVLIISKDCRPPSTLTSTMHNVNSTTIASEDYVPHPVGEINKTS